MSWNVEFLDEAKRDMKRLDQEAVESAGTVPNDSCLYLFGGVN